MPKIVFVTGGVFSSLGKGISAASIGCLLKSRGFNVKIKKIDPYLNVDPGTLSPSEHGEVYVTDDGAETDLDLGHYERLAGVSTSKSDYITSGSVYDEIIKKERNGDYLGKTIQVVPHVSDALKARILAQSDECDFLICEIGGTVGDIESVPILEAARQLRIEGNYDVMFCHVAFVPYLEKANEWKTKPVQHSVRTLLHFGIQPDMIICRMEKEPETDWKNKISNFCNVPFNRVVKALDANSVYHVIGNFENEGVDVQVLNYFKYDATQSKAELSKLNQFISYFDNEEDESVQIAIVAKYNECKDSYKSLSEAILHAGYFLNKKIKINWLDAEKIENEDLSNYSGILVPGGFGLRGIEGKIKAISFARKHNIPFLGICLGLQLSVIDSLREVLDDVSSSEFGNCKNPVIAKMEEWNCSQIDAKVKVKAGLGGSMRLGAYLAEIKKDTLAHKVYKKEQISERHRHRYEVNNDYLAYFEKVGLKVSGECGGLVEIVERNDCDFFIAVQFHPEFNSSIYKPNDLFIAFLQSASEKRV